MDKRVVYRGIAKSDVLDQHIEKHFARIGEFLDKEHGPAKADITLEVHKPAEQKATVHVTAPRFDFHASVTTNDIFSSISEVLDKAYAKLHEEKRRLTAHEHKGCGAECRQHVFERIEEEQAEKKIAENIKKLCPEHTNSECREHLFEAEESESEEE